MSKLRVNNETILFFYTLHTFVHCPKLWKIRSLPVWKYFLFPYFYIFHFKFFLLFIFSTVFLTTSFFYFIDILVQTLASTILWSVFCIKGSASAMENDVRGRVFLLLKEVYTLCVSIV